MYQDRNTPRRALTARSVLLSLLLGNDPPRSTVGALVRTAELFGIAEGTARTALSRMAAAGEVDAVDGRYELRSPDLLSRQRRQSESRAALTLDWTSARWVQAIVASQGRRSATDRAGTRRRLQRARLGELREGVWMRPDNLPPSAAPAPNTAASLCAAGPDLFWFTIEHVDEPVDLASRLWDLPAWAARAHQLVDHMERLLAPLQRGDQTVLADGFVTSADVLRHLQSDPLLPTELWPPEWPGAALRATYDVYDAAYRAALAGWFR